MDSQDYDLWVPVCLVGMLESHNGFSRTLILQGETYGFVNQAPAGNYIQECLPGQR